MAETTSVVLSWGKPTISIDGTALGYTPVENSTQLTVTKGDKKEAPVEGGGIEAVKYKKSKSQLKFTIRRAAGRTFPLTISGGVCPGEHSVSLAPEESGAPGFTIARAIITVDETYTAEDGAMWEVTADPMEPTDGSEAVAWDGTGGGDDDEDEDGPAGT